jgi:hypothetical protein
MEKDGATAIHLEVEIAFGWIGTGCEEEFNTTVPADAVLMLCR